MIQKAADRHLFTRLIADRIFLLRVELIAFVIRFHLPINLFL